ncbi:hypothetical protein CK203_094051 [Vitis vinifera]|uniref:Uncharacterized protein n=1 Tax=Vitis vinifera TaxID=29760 RepID=A0A438E181_VITVI|nr:hypothetical protein CK203_094051 [Vitis vinifera]
MERSDPPDPCKSTGSEPLVLLSENSYNSLTEGGWKASGYAHPIEERVQCLLLSLIGYHIQLYWHIQFLRFQARRFRSCVFLFAG